MKTKTFLALFCLLCISSGFSSCQRHSSDQWKLVWEDNFDQKTGFDPQVWSKIPRGKSYTLACCIEYINKTMNKHIITLEDPVEYEFIPLQSIIV